MRRVSVFTASTVIVSLCVVVNIASGAEGVAPPGQRRSTIERLLATPPSRTSFELEVAALDSMAEANRSLVLESTRGRAEIQLFRSTAAKVVYVFAMDGLGSGAIVSVRGRVVTNLHVVGDRKEVLVFIRPQSSRDSDAVQSYRANVVRVDPVRDLALLQIDSDSSDFESFTLGSLAGLEVGATVHAIGHPSDLAWTYTSGIVSQIRPEYEWSTDGEKPAHRATVVQTQTPISAGNSGGPLFDDAGRLVGINTFLDTGGSNLNFAVSIDDVRGFLDGVLAPQPTVAKPKDELDCPDVYDALGDSRFVVKACHIVSDGPPPDTWIVSRRKSGKLMYFLMTAPVAPGVRQTRLNAVYSLNSRDTVDVYVDADCDGYVDLLADQSEIGGSVRRVRLAPPALRLSRVAEELYGAVEKKRIPLGRTTLCMEERR